MRPRTMTEPEFMLFLIDAGYSDIRKFPDSRYAALCPVASTVAIVVGRVGDTNGDDDRWCYHDMEAACAALFAWDGTGEPAGWRHHLASQRVSQMCDE